MSDFKVALQHAFVMNCKMIYNDTAQTQTKLNRMWACSRNDADETALKDLDACVSEMLRILRTVIDN